MWLIWLTVTHSPRDKKVEWKMQDPDGMVVVPGNISYSDLDFIALPERVRAIMLNCQILSMSRISKVLFGTDWGELEQETLAGLAEALDALCIKVKGHWVVMSEVLAHAYSRTGKKQIEAPFRCERTFEATSSFMSDPWSRIGTTPRLVYARNYLLDLFETNGVVNKKAFMNAASIDGDDADMLLRGIAVLQPSTGESPGKLWALNCAHTDQIWSMVFPNIRKTQPIKFQAITKMYVTFRSFRFFRWMLTQFVCCIRAKHVLGIRQLKHAELKKTKRFYDDLVLSSKAAKPVHGPKEIKEAEEAMEEQDQEVKEEPPSGHDPELEKMVVALVQGKGVVRLEDILAGVQKASGPSRTVSKAQVHAILRTTCVCLHGMLWVQRRVSDDEKSIQFRDLVINQFAKSLQVKRATIITECKHPKFGGMPVRIYNDIVTELCQALPGQDVKTSKTLYLKCVTLKIPPPKPSTSAKGKEVVR